MAAYDTVIRNGTIATVVWKCLKMAGVDTRRVTGWGSLFQNV